MVDNFYRDALCTHEAKAFHKTMRAKVREIKALVGQTASLHFP
jgi:hypothetical protein